MKNNNINDENKPLPIPASLFNDLNNNTILKIFNDCEITYDQIPTILFKDLNNDAILEIFKNCKYYQPNSDCDFHECERV